MSLKLYNSLSRQVELFEPLCPPQVKLYVCGPTVYDLAHLGHARCYITWDVLYRTLMLAGYNVTYARNITDVDDKIIQRSAERGISTQELTQSTTAEFHADMKALNTLPPTLEPRATDHIDDMVSMIQTLLNKGMAYQAEGGDVYFRTQAKEDYGKLSRRPADALKPGARVEENTSKEHLADFALWKVNTDPSETVGWTTPFTNPEQLGRPGWHIECSSMIHALLGEQIDIHAGGADLLFPHHENEIAQSEACTGKSPFAQFWMHNGFVNVDGEKMSKSLGNFSTVRQVLERYDANTIRHFLLTHHYRVPVDFTPEALQASANWVSKLSRQLKELPDALVSLEEVPNTPGDTFKAAVFDDLNTPKALAEVNSTFATVKRTQQVNDAAQLLSELTLLGFDCTALLAEPESDLPEAFLKALALEHGVLDVHEKPAAVCLEAILTFRQTAKDQRNWALADLLRDQLAAEGFELMDKKGEPTQWRYEPTMIPA